MCSFISFKTNSKQTSIEYIQSINVSIKIYKNLYKSIKIHYLLGNLQINGRIFEISIPHEIKFSLNIKF